MKNVLLALSLLIFFSSCRNNATVLETDVNYEALPAYTEAGVLNAVVEIPAGTSHKIEYNKENKSFDVEQIDGKDRVVNYLPYVGNYGFIPSTYMNPEMGGDGDALDILVLCESVPTGTLLEVIPIALFRMKDDGEIDAKVIAIPADEKLQSFKVKNFSMLSEEFIKARFIIEYWFTSYKGEENIDDIHWQGLDAAKTEINRRRTDMR